MSAVVPELLGATVTLPGGGQTRLALPSVPRVPYPTGVQVPCAACVRAGVAAPRQGMPFRFAGESMPLCMPCWRAEERRRQRAADAELLARFWDAVGGVEVDPAGVATVAEVQAEACPACGQDEPGPSCWLCSYTWLARLREQFEDDQDAAAAVAGEDVARLAELADAEARVADLAGWIERLGRILAAWEDPARVGRWGRAVELTADLLARLAAGRTTTRGRPPLTALIGVVLACDADVRAGRRALPGRLRTAWLLDCSHRAVYDAQVRVVEVGWAVRTRRGGRNSLARRLETGRPNDRAEFDLVQLNESVVAPAVRAAYLPAALQLLDEVVGRAMVVLEREQDALDELRARADTWTDWAEQTRRVQLRAAVARARGAIGPTVGILVAHAAAPTAPGAGITCHTHTVSRGECVSSCPYWGENPPAETMIHSVDRVARPSGRRRDGASRSPTRNGAGVRVCAGFSRSHPIGRPRTRNKVQAPSQRRARPVWSSWAYPLARGVVGAWTWLAGVSLPQVAATLGARLGPDWTVDQVIGWVPAQRGRPILTDPDAALGYLRALLEDALTAGTVPPARARRHDEHRARVAADAHAQATARHNAVRAVFDERDAAAAGTGRAAARAVLAEVAARRAGPADAGGGDWPEVAQPGSGSPPRR